MNHTLNTKNRGLMVVVNQALCGIRHASHLYISKPSAAFPSDILPAKSSESRHSPFPPKI